LLAKIVSTTIKQLSNLGAMHVLEQHTLVLKHVTLGLQVQLVIPIIQLKLSTTKKTNFKHALSLSRSLHIHMFVDLFAVTVLFQQSTKHADAAHLSSVLLVNNTKMQTQIQKNNTRTQCNLRGNRALAVPLNIIETTIRITIKRIRGEDGATSKEKQKQQ
jgi:hypothetical protein